MKIAKANSALIQPKDRGYNRKGLKRENRLEVKSDEISHALVTRGDTYVVIEYDESENNEVSNE